jgi:precorrin-6B methylase 2
MRERIIEFLEREGIEKSSQDQVDKKLAERFGEELAQGLRVLRSGRGVKVDEMPQFYDLYQCFEGFYDLRMSFLLSIEEIIKQTQNKRQLTFSDGGCATGLDTCFLALEYPCHRFRGYDNQEGSINLAEERRNKLGLENVQFYVGDHTSPTPEESCSADILISKMFSGDDENSLYSTAKWIKQSASRLKEGGLYVCACFMDEEIGNLLAVLKKDGFSHELTQSVFISSQFGTAYNHVMRYTP